MNSGFDCLLHKIQTQLPDLITPDMIFNLGLADHPTQLRVRKRGEIPFLKISRSIILYTKKDVIDWLKRSYKEIEEDCLENCTNDDLVEQA